MARLLYRLGRLVAAHSVIVITLWIVVAVGVTLLVGRVGAETNNNVKLPGTGSQAASDLLAAGFPPRQNGSNPIIFHSSSGKVTDAADKTAITDSYAAIKKIPFVNSALSPFDQGGSAQISKDGKTAFISVLLDISSSELTEEEAQRVMDAAEPGKKAGMEVVGGASIGTVLSPNDTSTSDVIGILAAMLILTFTFGTVVAMGMPIGTAILGLTTALGVIGLLGHVIAVPSIAHTVATMIGLAVGIDYALFLVTRHRSQLREGIEMRESVALAVGTAGTAVVFAGCTVVVALVSLAVAGIPLVSALGYTAALAVATAVLAAVTLLPALMSLAGPFINRLALPARLHPSDDPEKVGLWGRWAAVVTRRPWVAVIVAVAVLAPLIYPVTSLRLGQENIGQTDPSTMERRAYDLIASGFGPGFNGPLLIAVALTPPATADPAVVAQENQLKAMQSQLEAEQKEGQKQQASLQKQQASLQKQQASLEQQQASLEQQAAVLQSQEASLKRRQASLQAQADQLEGARPAPGRTGPHTGYDGRASGSPAGEDPRDRAARAEPDRNRDRSEAQGASSRSGWHGSRPARSWSPTGSLHHARRARRSPPRRARSRRRPSRCSPRRMRCRPRPTTLQAQADQLQAQGDALQKQADSLKQQAAALEKQKDALLQLQATAKRAAAAGREVARSARPDAHEGRRRRSRHRPPAREAPGRPDRREGRHAGSTALDLEHRQRGDVHRDREHGTLGACHGRPRAPPALDRDPGEFGGGRHGVRRRLDRLQRRPGGRDLGPPAARDRHDPVAQHARAARGVPLGAHPDPGGDHELPHGHGRVRHPDRRLPVGLGHRLRGHRHHGLERPDRELRAAHDVRRALRAEHGLPGVPALVRRPLPRCTATTTGRPCGSD